MAWVSYNCWLKRSIQWNNFKEWQDEKYESMVNLMKMLTHFIPSLFYEAWIGIEVFVQRYTSR